MVAIGFEQQLSNSALCEHICMETIKKLYKTTGKFDDQHQCTPIIEAEMVSTPEGFTYNISMTPN